MAREPKIYLLPNLMTAGNLFCGFMAVLTIFRGLMVSVAQPGLSHDLYIRSILFIFGAFGNVDVEARIPPLHRPDAFGKREIG